MWLRKGTGGGHLRTRQSTFATHQMRGISCLSEGLLASQEGLCSMELVTLEQRLSNFFQVGTTFISQNVLRTILLLNVLSIHLYVNTSILIF
jgi:hypothetical protein